MLRSRAYLLAGALPLLLLALLLWRFLTAGPPRPADGAPGGASPALGPPPAPAAPPARALVPELPVRLAPTPLGDERGGEGSFEGRVVSAESGAGVADAELTFSRSGEATSVRAGRDGGFRFDPRLAGRWTLAAVAAPGFLPFAPEWGHSPVQLDARGGARVRGIVVALQPAVEYRGRAVDVAGRPVEGAEVRVLGAAAGEVALLPLPERFTSGADGTFRFVAPDGALLEARHPRYGTGRSTVDFAARVSRRLTLVLPPARAGDEEAAITGRVEYGAGYPADGAVVIAHPERRRGGTPRQGTSDLAGRFTLEHLPAGTYRLVATRPGFAPAVQAGVAAGGPEAILRLQAGGRLTGRVRDRRTGLPVAPFTVAVRPAGDGRRGPLRSLSVVDAAGRYELDDLAPGPAVVLVAAPGHAPSDELEVTIPDPGAAPAQADFELSAGGRIHGVALDARTRQPLSGARIEVEGQVRLGPSPLPVLAAAATGPDGSFDISGVPAEPVSLRAIAEGHHARILSGLQVGEGEARGPVSIELTPLAADEEPQVELTGIGAVLAPRGDHLDIVSVLPAGGAAEAGLGPGDEVVRVEGQPVEGLGFAAAINLIRGPEGSTVVLGVRKRDDPQRAELRVVVYRRLVRG